MKMGFERLFFLLMSFENCFNMFFKKTPPVQFDFEVEGKVFRKR
jgi:hypothetical protein